MLLFEECASTHTAHFAETCRGTQPTFRMLTKVAETKTSINPSVNVSHTFTCLLFAFVKTGTCLTSLQWFLEHMFTIYSSSLKVLDTQMLLFGIAQKFQYSFEYLIFTVWYLKCAICYLNCIALFQFPDWMTQLLWTFPASTGKGFV